MSDVLVTVAKVLDRGLLRHENGSCRSCYGDDENWPHDDGCPVRVLEDATDKMDRGANSNPVAPLITLWDYVRAIAKSEDVAICIPENVNPDWRIDAPNLRTYGINQILVDVDDMDYIRGFRVTPYVDYGGMDPVPQLLWTLNLMVGNR